MIKRIIKHILQIALYPFFIYLAFVTISLLFLVITYVATIITTDSKSDFYTFTECNGKKRVPLMFPFHLVQENNIDFCLRKFTVTKSEHSDNNINPFHFKKVLCQERVDPYLFLKMADDTSYSNIVYAVFDMISSTNHVFNTRLSFEDYCWKHFNRLPHFVDSRLFYFNYWDGHTDTVHTTILEKKAKGLNDFIVFIKNQYKYESRYKKDVLTQEQVQIEDMNFVNNAIEMGRHFYLPQSHVTVEGSKIKIILPGEDMKFETNDDIISLFDIQNDEEVLIYCKRPFESLTIHT